MIFRLRAGFDATERKDEQSGEHSPSPPSSSLPPSPPPLSLSLPTPLPSCPFPSSLPLSHLSCHLIVPPFTFPPPSLPPPSGLPLADSIAVALNIQGVGGGVSPIQELGATLRQRGSSSSLGFGGNHSQSLQINSHRPPLGKYSLPPSLSPFTPSFPPSLHFLLPSLPSLPPSLSSPLADVSLSMSNPLKLSKSPGDYQPIVESTENSSLDSYTLALEGSGR